MLIKAGVNNVPNPGVASFQIADTFDDVIDTAVATDAIGTASLALRAALMPNPT